MIDAVEWLKTRELNSAEREASDVDADSVQISDEEIPSGLSSDDCRKKLIRLISVRERCVSELRTRLLSDGFDTGVVEEQLEFAVRTGLVDDRRFAEAYVSGKLSAGWGRERIERELHQRQIELSSLPGYPELFFPEDEYERACASLQNYRCASKNVRESAYRRLISKGYSSDVASRAARTFCTLKSGLHTG